MSTFICMPDHFKALAVFASQKRHGSFRVDPRYIDGLDHPEAALRGFQNLTQEEIATLYAETLYAENVRSVCHRYPDSGRDNLPGPINDSGHVTVTYRDINKAAYNLPAVALLKMCDCLEYQSCETPNYRHTVAFELLSMIRRAAIRAIPGYEDAPWDFIADRKAA